MDLLQHKFVPKHIKLSEEETKEFLKKYNVTRKQLPKMIVKDPIAKLLEAKPGDIIKIKRKSPTVKIATYYRVVINA